MQGWWPHSPAALEIEGRVMPGAPDCPVYDEPFIQGRAVVRALRADTEESSGASRHDNRLAIEVPEYRLILSDVSRSYSEREVWTLELLRLFTHLRNPFPIAAIERRPLIATKLNGNNLSRFLLTYAGLPRPGLCASATVNRSNLQPTGVPACAALQRTSNETHFHTMTSGGPFLRATTFSSS